MLDPNLAEARVEEQAFPVAPFLPECLFNFTACGINSFHQPSCCLVTIPTLRQHQSQRQQNGDLPPCAFSQFVTSSASKAVKVHGTVQKSTKLGAQKCAQPIFETCFNCLCYGKWRGHRLIMLLHTLKKGRRSVAQKVQRLDGLCDDNQIFTSKVRRASLKNKN